MEPEPLKTFIIYSNKDKELREEFERHLRPLADAGWLDLWSDRKILPGELWEVAIKKRLNQTELFLILVSVDFYNSGYIREEEFKTALDRLESGDALIIPIIIRHCTWKFFPIIKDLQVLPPGGVAVTDMDHWKHRDKAWDAVVERIGERVEQLLEKRQRNVPKRQEETKPALVVVENNAFAAVEQKPPAKSTHLAHQNGQTCRDLPDGPEMVFVEGGIFEMGGEDEFNNAKPIHKVVVPSFWIGKFAVTFEEYDRFCAESGRTPPTDAGWGRGRRPVINVSWKDAQAYCKWLSDKTGKHYRLPSEAEWEFSARLGGAIKGTEFIKNNPVTKIEFIIASIKGMFLSGKTHLVDETPANGLHIHGMIGNIWEWCADQYHDNYIDAPVNGSAWMIGGHEDYRIVRGGPYLFNTKVANEYLRGFNELGNKFDHYGFRLARDF